MADIILTAVCVLNAAREAIAPYFEIAIGITTDCRNTGSAARHVNLAHIFHRYGKEDNQHLLRMQLHMLSNLLNLVHVIPSHG